MPLEHPHRDEWGELHVCVRGTHPMLRGFAPWDLFACLCEQVAYRHRAFNSCTLYLPWPLLTSHAQLTQSLRV
eukprot:10637521-Heterocapsa_arctica.AAC.2